MTKYNEIGHFGRVKRVTAILLIIFVVELSFPHLAVAQTQIVNDQEKKVLKVMGYFESPEQLKQDFPFISQTNTQNLLLDSELPQPKMKKTIWVTVTAYSSTPDQTDGSPYRTASMTYVRDGVIAANFLPIGTRVRLPNYSGDKVYIVEDRMNPRYYHRADIWMPTREGAKQFGVKYLKMEIL